MSEDLHHDQAHDEHHHDDSNTTVFGFWTFLMNDLILFGTLFIAFAVLMGSVPPGTPGPKELFGESLGFVLTETFALLISSVTFGFAMLALWAKKKGQVIFWLIVTFFFGLSFIAMELYEFNHLVHAGHGPSTSAFLSAFFTLVGTHGIHVTSGLLWLIVLIYQLSKYGINSDITRRLTLLSLFWHFLDIVWICVFSVVYLMGVLS